MDSMDSMDSMDDPTQTPASYGGPGWVPRTAAHAAEVRAGDLWHPCGVDSEFAPLREVLLCWPGDSLGAIDDPDRWLLLGRPDLKGMRAEMEQIVAFYEGQGVRVHLHRPADAPPNTIFMRDLIWMTPEGAVICRPAGLARAGEERHAAQALAGLGVPILQGMRGRGTFEGADALWVDPRTVAIGVGRTNAAGVDQLRGLLRALGADLVALELPPGVQHLLGMVVFLDRDLAVIHGGHATTELQMMLSNYGVDAIELPADDELTLGLGMNGVTLGPRRFVMPAGCPGIRRRLEDAGVEVHTLPTHHLALAAGALGCLTSPLRRDLIG